MSEFDFKLIDTLNDCFRDSIFEPLEQFNRKHAGDSGYLPLGVEARFDGTNTGAGLWGHTADNWLVIELLYVPDEYRHQKIGFQLVKLAETEAISRGCHSSWLDTFEYQARGFYEKIGYSVFGQLDNYSGGEARYFMSKSFAS